MLPEIMPPKDIGIGFQLLDSEGNPINLDLLSNLIILAVANKTVRVIEKFNKEEISGFQQLRKINTGLYYGIISAAKSLKCINDIVTFSIKASSYAVNILDSDELQGFRCLKPIVSQLPSNLPVLDDDIMSRIDVLLQFRTDRNNVAPVAPVQPSNAQILKSGSTDVTTAGTRITFDTPFPTTISNYGIISSFANGALNTMDISEKDNTGFTCTPAVNDTLNWIAYSL
jgi:hypothetical protein